MTQKVIDQAGGCIVVCGEKITNTKLDNAQSAEEGLCVPVEGTTTLQLARYLLAASLNCKVNGGPADCSASIIGPVYAKCDAACAAGRTIADDGTDCIEAGEYFLFHDESYTNPPGSVVGVCADGTACTSNLGCSDHSTCTSPAAGSINKCNQAAENDCAMVPCRNENGSPCATTESEKNCKKGLKRSGPETCN